MSKYFFYKTSNQFLPNSEVVEETFLSFAFKNFSANCHVLPSTQGILVCLFIPEVSFSSQIQVYCEGKS